MNILLVDDDSYVLETLRKSLDWDTMGIKNVYTAHSVNKAKKIFEDIPIQILICDIEMPKENGFELLKWIREKQYIIKDILLTSYAEFKYASEAIKMGCYAYALKPIDFEELEKMIIAAIEEEKKALSLVNHAKYYEYWTESQKIRKEQFFWDLLIDQQKLHFQDYDFDYQGGDLFVSLLITYPSDTRKHNYDFSRGMFEWTLNNLITELFTTDKCSVEAVLYLKKEVFLVVVKMNYNVNKSVLEEELSIQFLKKTQKNLDITCSIIIGKLTRLDQLQEDVDEFLKHLKKRLIELGEVTSLNNYEMNVTEFRAPDFTIWEKFLRSGQDETVKKEVAKYLDKQLASNKLDKDILHSFVTNFLQLLITVLNDNGINTYQMEKPLFSAEFINSSIQNVTNAKKGINQMIEMVKDMFRNQDKDKPIVQTVIKYIDCNLDKDITRESLAEQVYLNQDYLARIFKKEIGESIGNYITGKRIEVAKEYLSKTSESVNSIAIKVGYDNFSYFTKIFKDRVGMTPKDYRKLYDKVDDGSK